MNNFSQVATTLLGLLSGGMMLIALGLVPYWRSLDPAEFTSVFAASLPSVGGTMAALSVIGTVAIVVAAGLAARKKLPSRAWLSAGAAGAVIMLVTVPLYFGSANPLLAGGTLSESEIAAELATWQQMHWFRTIVGVLALLCSIRAGYARPGENR
ncbi:MAG: hypothetical protein NPIRA05_03430 [Nitrospirales bacterium]|nr:MAG: hypothetical protein NPIRA05_03430 [Nitrospirales bacterium]